MPYRITQCYLPPGRGDIPALTPAEAGTRFSDPEGMQVTGGPDDCVTPLTTVHVERSLGLRTPGKENAVVLSCPQPTSVRGLDALWTIYLHSRHFPTGRISCAGLSSVHDALRILLTLTLGDSFPFRPLSPPFTPFRLP